MSDELSPSEVARRLGTSTRTVQRWIESGKLPARRVGGRWRVANVAFDAFDGRMVRGADGRSPIQRPVHREPRRDRRADRRTCERLGIAAIVPATDGPDAIDLLDIDARRRGRPGSRRRCRPPGFRVPRRERRLRRGGRCRRADMGRTAAGGHPGDGRQGRRAPPRRLARRPGAPRLRRPGPVRRRPDRRGRADRLPAARQAVGRWRRQGHADRPRPGRARRRARVRPAGGDGGLRRRAADPRAAGRGRTPRRDPGPLRCPRERRPPRRARLLDPAAPPEGPRGGAVARHRRRASRPARRGGADPGAARSAT